MKTVALLFAFVSSVFTQSGTLDQAFANSGFSTVACRGTLRNAVMQSDGKIVMLFDGSNTTEGNKLVRFNPDGSPDATFGTSGIAYFFWPAAGGGNGMPWSMTLQDDEGVQKIIVAGFTKMSVKGKSADALRVDRFFPDGTPDAAFGSGGSAIYKTASAMAIVIQPGGKIITAGELGQLVRLNQNGSLDTTFGSGGTANGNSLIYPNAIAVQQDGKIVAAGYSSSKNKTLATVARYNVNGSVDTAFGVSGRRTVDFLGGKAWDVLIAPDGSIIAGGTSGSTSATQNAVAARFTATGQLDASFGNGGVASYDSGTGDVGWRIGLQPDGMVLITGNVISGLSGTGDLLTARFDSDGDVDYSFGDLGGAVTDVNGFGSTSRGVFIHNIGTNDQPEYRILVAGTAGGSGQSYAILARYMY